MTERRRISIPWRTVLTEGFEPPKDEPVMLVVERATVHVVELQLTKRTAWFESRSCVLMPEGGIPATVAILKFLHENPEYELMIAAHMPIATTRDETLAQERMKSIQSMLVPCGWAQHAREHYRNIDIQRLLMWTQANYGWDCDPHGIDNAWEEGSQTALLNFRKEYFATRQETQTFTDQMPTRYDIENFGALLEEKMTQRLTETLAIDVTEIEVLRRKISEPNILRVSHRMGCNASAPRMNNYSPESDARIEALMLEKEIARTIDIEAAVRVHGDSNFKARKIEYSADGVPRSTQPAVNDVVTPPFSPIDGDYVLSTFALDQFIGLTKIFDVRTFCKWIQMIFGEDISTEAVAQMYSDLESNLLTVPIARLVDPSVLNGNLAGYNKKTGTIDVSIALAAEARENAEASWKLCIALVEEFGHYIDTVLRGASGGDAKYDEGALLAYAIVNPKWDEKTSVVYGSLRLDGVVSDLTIEWSNYKVAIDTWLADECILHDEEDIVYEYFSANRGVKRDDHQTFGHQDLEDGLGEAGFSEIEIRHVYLGNWLRDHSQFVDNFLILRFIDFLPLWDFLRINLFDQFRAVATRIVELLAKAQFYDIINEAKVDENTLGVYLPWEHIDNPKGYDPSDYSPPLRPPVNALEHDTNPVIMAKYYIGAYDPNRGCGEQYAHDRITATGYIRQELSKAYAYGRNSDGFLRLGNALHVLEDFYAHSNFVELALSELGYDVVTWTHPSDASFCSPLVTGTFGFVDTAASLLFKLGEHMTNVEKKGLVHDRFSARLLLALVSERPSWRNALGGVLDSWQTIENGLEQILSYPGLSMLSAMFKRIAGMIKRGIGRSIIYLAETVRDLQAEILPGSDPTHTQLAKDSVDHPLHEICGILAKNAVAEVGSCISNAWDGYFGVDVPITIATQYIINPWFLFESPSQFYGPIAGQIDAIQEWAARNPEKIGNASDQEFLKGLQELEIKGWAKNALALLGSS